MLQQIKQKALYQVIIIYTRYLIGGTFVFASLIKIKGHRFTTESGADMPIDTAWHFFETMYASGLYWQFLGLGQLISGFLLLTQRYATLGAVVFYPIILNIFVITLSYYFAFTPLITGGMFLATTILLLWDYDKLKILLNKKPEIVTKERLENHRIWEYTGLALFLFTFGYRLIYNQYNIFLWASLCMLIGLGGLAIAYFYDPGIRNTDDADTSVSG